MPDTSSLGDRTVLTKRHAGLVPIAEYMRMSTDHQRYSIEFQCAAIRRFAIKHGMTVVRTYLDDGKSGLTLRGRPGLQRLLKDVISGRADYDAVLVYDVSRWGRFQDTDEAAYYEFMCKQVGIKVVYCSEPFDDTPMGGLFKNIKRVMAGEYSRNLSSRVWGGLAQSAAAGFKPGGQAGYGLRRLLLSADGQPRCMLEKGQWKVLASDRVILVPGPREEVETVWWIFDAYALDKKLPKQIADELNARSPNAAVKWTRGSVGYLLSSPKYVGDNVFNRVSRKLKDKTTRNPESMWVRHDQAFRGLVTRERFDYVATLRKQRGRTGRLIDDYTLRTQLRKLLQREGHLSSTLIDRQTDMADIQTYIKRFGSVQAAFASVGYCSLTRHPVAEWQRQHNRRFGLLLAEMRDVCRAAAVKAQWDAKAKVLWVSSDRTIAVALAVLRCFRHHRALHWHCEKVHLLKFDECLVVRMDYEYKSTYDLHLLPASALPAIPKKALTADSRALVPYRIPSLSVLASRWKLNIPTEEPSRVLATL